MTGRQRLRSLSLGRGRGADRGAATIWVIACCALVLVLATAASARSLAVLARHRAETVADLAALAAAGRIGVAVPVGAWRADRRPGSAVAARQASVCTAARWIAQRNGGLLLTCRVRLAADERSGQVTVRVAVVVDLPVVGTRTVSASARAARLP